jgi:uncharacterized protein (DUF305 family)
MFRNIRVWKALIVAVLAAMAVLVLDHSGSIDRTANSVAEMISELCGLDGSFVAENRAAMHRMMKTMDVPPSGDADRDFAAMMIPHHQGAIEMAQAELRHGRNEQLRRIAQGIIVEQQQEIAAMRLAVDQGTGASAISVRAEGDR